jgi:hypothetical protein
MPLPPNRTTFIGAEYALRLEKEDQMAKGKNSRKETKKPKKDKK